VFNVQVINVRVSGKRNHELTRIRQERVFNVQVINVRVSGKAEPRINTNWVRSRVQCSGDKCSRPSPVNTYLVVKDQMPGGNLSGLMLIPFSQLMKV
jgi:hypothetical protein